MAYPTPGDVDIISIVLKNDAIGAFTSPIDQVIGFDIFEDITKPTLYASFIFEDSIGLLDSFPIQGEETLEVEFQTKGMPKATKASFRVFEISDIQPMENNRGQRYVLRCVSGEHFHNSKIVTRTITGTMDQCVQNVLRKELASDKQIVVEPSRGIQTLAVPSLTPLETIDWARQRAVSSKNNGSLYVFFETLFGFTFKTIEGLIEDGKTSVGSRIFNTDNNLVQDQYSFQRSYRTILNYQHLKKADSNLIAQAGGVNATIGTFDVATKKYTTTNFSALTSSFAQLSKDTKRPQSDKFFEQHKGKVDFLLPVDSLNSETFIPATVGLRNALSLFLQQNITRVHVPGDSAIKVGDVVELRLPELTGFTIKEKPDSKIGAGRYLITRLRHIVTVGSRSTHEVTFDCVKLGVSA